MKNRDKMSKINLIMSVISLDIVIVILCFNLGKIYLTIILGIGIIIELNLLIRYLTERNLTEKSKLEYSNSTKRHSAMKFFGNQRSADGGKNSFCDIQEDYNDFIKNVYEPLREKDPNYIKREIIGKDSSNQYNIYAYTFEPRYFQQHILLVSGIHADEEDAVASLGKIMQIITEESGMDGDILYMRQNVKISVIPVANPWGFSQKPKKRNNVSGYTLQSFDKKKNIKEVDYIKKYINRIKSDLSFMVDMHTTTNDSYLDFYGVIHKNCPNVRTLFRVNSWLCTRYNFRSNIDININRYLSTRLDLGARITDRNAPGTTAGRLMTICATQPPYLPILVEENAHPQNEEYIQQNPRGMLYGDNIYRYNLLGELSRTGYLNEKNTYLNGSFAMNLDMGFLTKGLKAEIMFSYDASEGRWINRKLDTYKDGASCSSPA